MVYPSNKIIVFEGLDNCFKETNMNSFIEELKYEYPYSGPIFTESFPRYDSWSSNGIKKWLNNEFDREELKKNPNQIKLLYTFDRLIYWNEKNEDFNRTNIDLYRNYRGICFIFDKYNISNIIYNNTDMPEPSDFLYEKTIGIPNPDIVIWFGFKDFELYKTILKSKSNKDYNEKDINLLYEAWKRVAYVKSNNILKQAGIESLFIYCDTVDHEIKTKERLKSELWTRFSILTNKLYGSRISKNEIDDEVEEDE